MGLLFLLRRQDGSLLLLDEPETHFNDVWKREIVEMVDLGLLNSTEANVIVEIGGEKVTPPESVAS